MPPNSPLKIEEDEDACLYAAPEGAQRFCVCVCSVMYASVCFNSSLTEQRSGSITCATTFRSP